MSTYTQYDVRTDAALNVIALNYPDGMTDADFNHEAGIWTDSMSTNRDPDRLSVGLACLDQCGNTEAYKIALRLAGILQIPVPAWVNA
jgi:hypothetical protein